MVRKRLKMTERGLERLLEILKKISKSFGVVLELLIVSKASEQGGFGVFLVVIPWYIERGEKFRNCGGFIGVREQFGGRGFDDVFSVLIVLKINTKIRRRLVGAKVGFGSVVFFDGLVDVKMVWLKA